MILSSDERTALQNGEVLRLLENGLECVVVRADVYDRVKMWMFDDAEWTDQDLKSALARSAEANGWNEPGMDAYDNYDDEVSRK
jgi:hypothetical protein